MRKLKIREVNGLDIKVRKPVRTWSRFKSRLSVFSICAPNHSVMEGKLRLLKELPPPKKKKILNK